MSAIYETGDVRFQYPENWTIEDEETVAWPRSVTVQNPTGAYWAVMLFDGPHDPETITRDVVHSMRGEYEVEETHAWTEAFDGRELHGHEMYFYCMDYLVRSLALGARHDGRTLIVLWQAEDREFTELELVFRAITLSLLRSFDGRRDE